MQTPREVIESIMRRGSPERVGLYDRPWADTLTKWLGQGMPADARGAAVDPVEHFGFDIARLGGVSGWKAVHGREEVIEETDEWRIVRDGNGAVLKWWKNKSGTPEHIDFAMTGREVWQREYRPHLLAVDRRRLDLDAGPFRRRTAAGLWTCYGSRFVWECMRAAMGDCTLYESLLTDPGWVHDYCRVYTDFYKAHYRALFEQVGVPSGVWVCEDLGYKERLFASPATLRELIFPYYAELVEFFHGCGLAVILHTCGFTEPALDLILEAGFDALHPMEVKAGNDPLRIAERCGHRLALIGGMDVRVLESGDRREIRRAVAELIEGMKARGARYVYASDHSISTNVDYDDFRFSLDVYREHRAY